MAWFVGMQFDEVSTIQRHDRTLIAPGGLQNRVVGNGLPGQASIGSGDDVVAGVSQGFNDREREVFVGEEPRHDLRAIVVGDLTIDLVTMGTNVGPGAGEILRL